MRLEGPLETATLPLGVSMKSCPDRTAWDDPGRAFLTATLVDLRANQAQHDSVHKDYTLHVASWNRIAVLDPGKASLAMACTPARVYQSKGVGSRNLERCASARLSCHSDPPLPQEAGACPVAEVAWRHSCGLKRSAHSRHSGADGKKLVAVGV